MKILIVDDHELFRDGLSLTLKRLCSSIDAEAVLAVSHAGSANEAIATLEQGKTFDLIMLDLELPDDHGLKLLARFKALLPQCPVVIISATEKYTDIKRALHAGAVGFMPKSMAADVMLSALRLVLSGGRYLPPQLLCDEVQTEQLTERQIEVLKSMHSGMSNKMIARELTLSESTVKTHIRKIFSILQAKNRSHAINIATQLKIL